MAEIQQWILPLLGCVCVNLREERQKDTQDLFWATGLLDFHPFRASYRSASVYSASSVCSAPVQLASGFSVLLSSLAHYFTSHCWVQNLLPHLCPTHVAWQQSYVVFDLAPGTCPSNPDPTPSQTRPQECHVKCLALKRSYTCAIKEKKVSYQPAVILSRKLSLEFYFTIRCTFFCKSSLLRQKLNMVKISPFKICTSLNFDKHIQSCNFHHNQDIKHLYHPPEFPLPLLRSVSCPQFQPQDTTHLFSVPVVFSCP